MKFVIDYEGNDPSKESKEKLETIMAWIKEQLAPIMDELKNCDGIFILHLNEEYEVKDTPQNVWYKIDQKIKPNFFPGF